MPREEGFFELFFKQAKNIEKGAKALVNLLSHYTGVPEQVQTIKAIEHDGDEITHGILTKLNQTFITPFDREDIHQLCSQLDDVIDLIDAAASRFVSAACISRTPPGPSCSWLIESMMIVFAPFATQCSIAAR